MEIDLAFIKLDFSNGRSFFRVFFFISLHLFPPQTTFDAR